MQRCMIAIDHGGKPRVPSEAAVMEYVLAMATGDVESRRYSYVMTRNWKREAVITCNYTVITLRL